MSFFDPPEVCTLCDQKKHSGTNSRAAGGWVCIACYRKELAPRVACSKCGALAPVSAWSGKRRVGRPFCVRCYPRNLHLARCSECGKKKPIHTRAKGRALCVDCYDKLIRDKGTCSSCGLLRRVFARSATGEALCRPCYQRSTAPTERCFVCRRLAHPVARQERGPICVSCYDRGRVAPCAYCQRTMRIERRMRDGRPICASCAFLRLTPLRRCAVCGEEKRTRRRTSEGKPLCNTCYNRQSRQLQ
jgi:formylmethanofuran dehydrogenase subunit E